jgi:hypothetical protein
MTTYGTRRFYSLEITVPVCTECNNRWLSVLERDVQPVLTPLIHGDERRLSSDGQRLLATWAVKTALMLDLATESPIIPTGFFHAFRPERAPLASHVVWLGAYMGRERAIWSAQQALHIGVPEDGEPNGFATTFTVFRALFQVVGHFTRGDATITDTRLWSAGLWPIAPIQHAVIVWPRQGFAFDDQGLDHLARSITSGGDESGA